MERNRNSQSVEERIARAGQILRRAGLRKTDGRCAILEVFMEPNQEPMTQQELSERVKSSGLNGVSIYRALDALVRAKILHRIETGEKATRYAMCLCQEQEHCHPHFVCRLCGRVECLKSLRMPDVSAPAPGYKVDGQEYYLRGVCKDCS